MARLPYEDTPVAILAGGLATRMRPLTETLPKAMLEAAGDPFVAHQLRLIAGQGLRRVVLCLGYLGEQVEHYVGDGSRFNVDVQYSYDGPVLLGTAGALKLADRHLDEQFITLYGDSYLPVDFRAAYESWVESDRAALMTVFRNSGQWDASNVEFAGGHILDYNKKNRTPRMEYIDYGLGMFRRNAFDRVTLEKPYDLADLYRNLLAEGDLAGYESAERFYEIGSFQGLNDFDRYISQLTM